MKIVLDWNRHVEPHLDSIRSVEGGFSEAQRGIVTTTDNDCGHESVFVKIATSENTRAWILKEIDVYRHLNELEFAHAAGLLAVRGDSHAMAIEDLSQLDFSDVWSEDKLRAIAQAQEKLASLTEYFIDSGVDLRPPYDVDANHWSVLLERIDELNAKFRSVEPVLEFSSEQLASYAALNNDWQPKQDTVIHADLRGDNFGYDEITKTGKMIDWNWLSLGDAAIDRAGLYISIYRSGLNPYDVFPEHYDRPAIAFIMNFWLECILNSSEDMSENEQKIRNAQAASIQTCIQMLELSA